MGQTDQPGLAGGVVGLAAVTGNTADGREQNHPAVITQGATVEQGFGQHLRGVEVDSEHRIPELGGHVGQGFVAGNTRVVHHDIDAVCQVLDQLCRGVGGTDVQRDTAPAQACGQGIKVVFG